MKSQPRFCEAEHLWMHNSNGNRSELTPSACQRCGIGMNSSIKCNWRANLAWSTVGLTTMSRSRLLRQGRPGGLPHEELEMGDEWR